MKTGRAIVIGGSMAGLLAARVLSECFQEVVVLERDRIPCGAAHRKGTPQSRHVHVLLARGLEVFEELFPGLTEELIEGSVPVSAPEQHLYWIGGGYYCPIDYPHRGVHPSRPLLEAAVRSRVFARPNVRLLDGISVVAFVASGTRERIHGVQCSHSESDDRATEDTLEADLVIDATGRGSHTPAWLEGMGYPRPREERVDVGMGYTTRHYRREPGQLDGKHFEALSATPTCRRGAIASAQEGDRWIVTLAGYPGDHPPTDEAGFVAFAATLAAPDVHDLISRAKPIDDPTPARYPASQRRHYEELSRFPEGLVVFGDASSTLGDWTSTSNDCMSVPPGPAQSWSKMIFRRS